MRPLSTFQSELERASEGGAVSKGVVIASRSLSAAWHEYLHDNCNIASE